jgi:hypothetical protein
VTVTLARWTCSPEDGALLQPSSSNRRSGRESTSRISSVALIGHLRTGGSSRTWHGLSCLRGLLTGLRMSAEALHLRLWGGSRGATQVRELVRQP